jgi:hypothetical protein
VGTVRTRVTVLIAVCVLAVGGAVAFVVASRVHQKAAQANAAPVAQTDLASVAGVPHIVFRSTNLRTSYGMTAMVPVSDPGGPRAFTESSCNRVYATSQNFLCLVSSGGVVAASTAAVLDTNLNHVRDLPLAGVPSRARLSRDGKYAATTSFVAGDSYASASFSTRTTITDLDGNSGSLGFENFRLIHLGEHISPVDRNYWGMTFAADDDTFYATVRFSGHTWLVRGSIARRTAVTLTQDAECPSLSPDGQHIVYKQRANRPAGRWRLVRYDIETGRITPLAEQRSVDDQVEWLDNGHVLYGLPRPGAEASVDDIWEVPADGSGAPRVLIPQAWSPAVVR